MISTKNSERSERNLVVSVVLLHPVYEYGNLEGLSNISKPQSMRLRVADTEIIDIEMKTSAIIRAQSCCDSRTNNRQLTR